MVFNSIRFAVRCCDHDAEPALCANRKIFIDVLASIRLIPKSFGTRLLIDFVNLFKQRGGAVLNADIKNAMCEFMNADIFIAVVVIWLAQMQGILFATGTDRAPDRTAQSARPAKVFSTQMPVFRQVYGVLFSPDDRATMLLLLKHGMDRRMIRLDFREQGLDGVRHVD